MSRLLSSTFFASALGSGRDEGDSTYPGFDSEDRALGWIAAVCYDLNLDYPDVIVLEKLSPP